MKKILITGEHGYIGTSLAEYLSQWPEEYQTDFISLRDDRWKEQSFAGYDAIVYAAGIAHIKETKENAALYYKVNRDLALETAGKAKKDGVRQFIYLSSMSVYGVETGVITPNTELHPKNSYGKSKLEAERILHEMECESFCVTILRPPMVYGKNCKGNFQKVIKIVKKSPVFPKVRNQRSMIYIENLCEAIREMIDRQEGGLFLPQDAEYMNTSHMAELIAQALGKQIYLSRLAGVLVTVGMPFSQTLRKAFGSQIYKTGETVICCNGSLLDAAVEKSVGCK